MEVSIEAQLESLVEEHARLKERLSKLDMEIFDLRCRVKLERAAADVDRMRAAKIKRIGRPSAPKPTAAEKLRVNREIVDRMTARGATL